MNFAPTRLMPSSDSSRHSGCEQVRAIPGAECARYPRLSMNRRPQLEIVAPDASPEEAAAVAAALSQFMRVTAPPLVEPPPRPNAWARAALAEGVMRQPDEAPSWG